MQIKWRIVKKEDPAISCRLQFLVRVNGWASRLKEWFWWRSAGKAVATRAGPLIFHICHYDGAQEKAVGKKHNIIDGGFAKAIYIRHLCLSSNRPSNLTTEHFQFLPDKLITIQNLYPGCTGPRSFVVPRTRF